ncbi:septum formation initiator family protein [Candidatus Giovannonibacteria bacterium]|nr:septum formation initiator family protein [Candidatus Giovannonibacteria bacterium]
MAFREIQEKKKIEHIIYSWPIILAIFAILGTLFWGTMKQWKAKIFLEKNIAGLEQKLQETKKESFLLKNTLESLNTPEGLDREAREKFNLKKEGEEVAVFIEDKNEMVSATTTKKVEIWESVKKFFNF